MGCIRLENVRQRIESALSHPCRRLRSCAFISSLIALGCSDQGTTSGRVVTFESSTCEAGSIVNLDPATVECGWLTVPESRDRPDGRTVRIAVLVMKATAPDPAPDPLLILNGGPGVSTLGTFTVTFSPSFVAPVRRKRDLVFLDHRGTGLSRPLLDCPEFTSGFFAGLRLQPTSELAAAMARCRRRYDEAGIDVSSFGSRAMAADAEDLMLALGYERWNIFGLSYGTRVAQVTLRDLDSSRVRSVVLDSVGPLRAFLFTEMAANLDRALDGLFRACEQDSACAAAYPDLEATFVDLVERLTQRPSPANLLDLATSRTMSLQIDGDRLVLLVRAALADLDQAGRIPLALTRFAAGDPSALRNIPGLVAAPSATTDGLNAAVFCSEEIPFAFGEPKQLSAGVRPVVNAASASFGDLWREVCGAWGSGEAAPSSASPAESQIPTLTFSGELDPITTIAYAREVARSLPRSHVVEFPQFGHALIISPLFRILDGTPSCAMRLLGAFLENPEERPTHECLESLPSLDFALP